MIRQGFHIGDRDWYIMAYYDIRYNNLDEVAETLYAAGCSKEATRKATDNLSHIDSGYTYTNFRDHLTIVCTSRATSVEDMYDTVQHELKHIVEHLCEYYDVDPRSEAAAYLQGEIGRKMFPAVAFVICPRCN